MNKKFAILVLSVLIVVTTLLITMFEIVIPSSKYSDAEKFLNNKEYIRAIELYDELSNYKDSQDKAISTRYLLATSYFESKDYQKAYETFFKIIDYKDSLSKRNESGYAYAQQLLADGKHEEAAKVFEVAKDYKDSVELKNQCILNVAKKFFEEKDYYSVITMCEKNGSLSSNEELYKAACYNYGLEKSASGNVETAIIYFDKADDYSDAKELIKLEKYNYVKANMDKNHPITFEYLKELKDAGYGDSASIYNDWYGWNVTVIAVNSDTGNRITNRKAINKKYPVIFHYKLNGGAPNEKMFVNIKMYLPNGEVFYDQSEWAMKDGSVNWHGWENGVYDDGNGVDGTVKMEFYDSEKKLIGEGTVEVVS